MSVYDYFLTHGYTLPDSIKKPIRMLLDVISEHVMLPHNIDSSSVVFFDLDDVAKSLRMSDARCYRIIQQLLGIVFNCDLGDEAFEYSYLVRSATYSELTRLVTVNFNDGYIDAIHERHIRMDWLNRT
jgi:hypothetical protein